MNPAAVKAAFVMLQAAGFWEPRSYEGKRGLDEGVAVWTMVLKDVTEAEIKAAIVWWISAPPTPDEQQYKRKWPKPHQLLGVVPHMLKAEEEWRAVEKGNPSLVARLIVRHLGDQVTGDDGRTFRQAFREFMRRSEAMGGALRLSDSTPGRDGQGVTMLVDEAIFDSPLVELDRLLEAG